MESTGAAKPVVDLPPTRDDDVFRLLVIAADEHVGGPVREEIKARADGRNHEVRVVAPALAESGLKHAMGDVDEAREGAEQRLGSSLDDIGEGGPAIDGRIGDSDPVLAIEDALREFPADEILIVTHPEDEGRWLEGDLFDRARQRFARPILHVTIDPEGDSIDAERSDGEPDPASDAEIEPSKNMPRFSVRDLAGIAVAIIGTIVMFALAAGDSPGVSESSRDPNSNTAELLIAGAMALINVAHVVALTLFQSVGYRGGWDRFFARFSLVGTLIAIIAIIVI